MTPVTPPDEVLLRMDLALDKISEEAHYLRSLAELWRIMALQMIGLAEEASSEARYLLDVHHGPLDTRTGRLMLALGAIDYAEAEVAGMTNLARAFRSMALQTGHQLSLGWANFMAGWAAYQDNRIDEAAARFEEVIATRYAVPVSAALDSFSGLIRCQLTSRRTSDAQNTLELMQEFLVDQEAYTRLPIVDALRMRVVRSKTGAPTDPAMFANIPQQIAGDMWDPPVLCGCRALIVSGDEDRLKMANEVLSTCREAAQSRNNKRTLIWIEGLQALLFQEQGEEEKARRALGSAVQLGEPGGALRILPDIGPQLIPLLRDLRDEGVAPAYIGRMLALFEDTVSAEEVGEERGARMSAEATAVLGDLTNREMEVLLLLAERLTNKEIAAELHISPHTVKKYTLELYRKLNVDGRRQAVARARELGIV